MEVTKTNFNDVLPTLSEVFNKAQFLSFDTEFTGLRIDGAVGASYFDTLEALYLKDRLKAETFMAIQFGVVAFFYDKSTKKHTHAAYNFYVYPSSYSDVNFTCQSKSIEFLVQNGFDMNKVFALGIPYLKDSDVEKLLEKLEEKQGRSQLSFENNAKQVEMQNENSTLVETVLNKIESIIETNRKSTFTLDRHNSYLRRLIYGAVSKKYGSKVFMVTNKDETMDISVGFSDDEIKQKQLENYLNEKEKILNESGFCKVIKLIMESKKLLCGHNLFIDILFTIRQFLTVLPESYSEFKELLNFLFPYVIDTKYLASLPNFTGMADTSLQTVISHFKGLNKIPMVNVADGKIGYDIDDNKSHEAAYDAYLTGLAFLAMSESLGHTKPIEDLTQNTFLKPFLNKLSVRRLHGISHMNIAGKDSEPDRKGVYYLTFPKEWKKENISDLFQNCGFINISWINDTSAFVSVKNEFIDEANKKLLNYEPQSVYKLYSYNEYRKLSSSNETNHTKGSKVLVSSNLNCESDETAKKRQIEDTGEVIERPPKKSK